VSETKPWVWRGAPKLGQDIEATLTQAFTGYSQTEITGLKGKGVID
jgi:hypothetical protein